MQYSVDDLVRVARRDNNTIRPYLYVNPLQGKHIPISPGEILKMCEALAQKVNARHPKDSLCVIGFAETATGVAAITSSYLNNIMYYQNTTREYKEGEEYLYFTESHSHARDQMLRSAGLDSCINNVDRIIFIDDEVTTGKTICKLIDVLKVTYNTKDLKFSIVSLLNSMKTERVKELADIGIDCIFLVNLPFEYKKDKIINITKKKELHSIADNMEKSSYDEVCFESVVNSRKILKYATYQEENKRFSDFIKCQLKNKHYERVLVLGTEEFLYSAICVGKMMEDEGIANQVRIHSTTRSPILASDYSDYPLKHRYRIRSLYDARRITYIYNIEMYDKVLIITDAINYISGLTDLCSILAKLGNEDILLGRWKYSEV